MKAKGLACSREDCADPVWAKGLCNKHYRRQLSEKKLKPCACGCGELTIYTYKHGHHTRLFSSEEQSRRASFNDGSVLRDSGAGKSYRKLHQRHEHRQVVESRIGRSLRSDEVVHHLNSNRRDNRSENLVVMTRAEHMRIHWDEMYAARKANSGS